MTSEKLPQKSDPAKDLRNAAARGQLQVAKEILTVNKNTSGFDIDGKSTNLNTAIFWAAKNNHDDVVALLREEGANPAIPGEEGLVLDDLPYGLRQAARTGDLEKTRAILKKNKGKKHFDINAKHYGPGDTALIIAARSNFDDVADLLIDEGAKTDEKNNAVLTVNHFSYALRRAIRRGEVPEAQTILRKNNGKAHFKLDEQDQRTGMNALLLSAERQLIPLVDLLLSAGASSDVANRARQTIFDFIYFNPVDASKTLPTLLTLLKIEAKRLGVRNPDEQLPMRNSTFVAFLQHLKLLDDIRNWNEPLCVFNLSCGQALELIVLSKFCRALGIQCRYVGVDSTAQHIEWARKNFTNKDGLEARFYCMTAFDVGKFAQALAADFPGDERMCNFAVVRIPEFSKKDTQKVQIMMNNVLTRFLKNRSTVLMTFMCEDEKNLCHELTGLANPGSCFIRTRGGNCITFLEGANKFKGILLEPTAVYWRFDYNRFSDSPLCQPIREAAARGNLDVVKRIYAEHKQKPRFNINAIDEHRNSALLLSVRAGHFGVAAYLLEEGADDIIFNNEGKSIYDCFNYKIVDQIQPCLLAIFDNVINRLGITDINFKEAVFRSAMFFVTLKLLKIEEDLQHITGPITILSLGCGVPTEIPALLKLFQMNVKHNKFRYIGIDNDPEKIKIAKKLFSDPQGQFEAEFHCCDASNRDEVARYVSAGSCHMGLIRNGEFLKDEPHQVEFVRMVEDVFPVFLQDSSPVVLTFPTAHMLTHLGAFKAENSYDYSAHKHNMFAKRGEGVLAVLTDETEPDLSSFTMRFDQRKHEAHLAQQNQNRKVL